MRLPGMCARNANTHSFLFSVFYQFCHMVPTVSSCMVHDLAPGPRLLSYCYIELIIFC